jgi:hypothetical protein
VLPAIAAAPLPWGQSSALPTFLFITMAVEIAVMHPAMYSSPLRPSARGGVASIVHWTLPVGWDNRLLLRGSPSFYLYLFWRSREFASTYV